MPLFIHMLTDCQISIFDRMQTENKIHVMVKCVVATFATMLRMAIRRVLQKVHCHRFFRCLNRVHSWWMGGWMCHVCMCWTEWLTHFVHTHKHTKFPSSGTQ